MKKTKKRPPAGPRSKARNARRSPGRAGAGGTATSRWSKRVTETSDALDLEQRVFRKLDPREIARSLKRSAERSRRRKSAPFRSAMSMLSFYINRAGTNLPLRRKRILEQAKVELRKLFHQQPKV
jgi:hypothetical protein